MSLWFGFHELTSMYDPKQVKDISLDDLDMALKESGLN
ncbi:hypothetical protein C5167_044975 [Papaver somniferum]|uniref:Uncharacterized protein n=1 Tax=Papaver somniferum TaxID=3469 RepID=A0A4Y7LAC6_PAPSO|nr:hypothetical protein C5167_044975 [Papaver somniferum]